MNRNARVPLALGALLVLGVTPAGSATRVDVPLEISERYRVSWDDSTGCVRSLQARDADPAGEPCESTPLDDESAWGAALDFLWQHAEMFRLRPYVDELVPRLNAGYACGRWIYLSFDGRYRGLPVEGVAVRVMLDRSHGIERMSGEFVPSLDLDPTPRVSEWQALEIAASAIPGAEPRRAVCEPLGIVTYHGPWPGSGWKTWGRRHVLVDPATPGSFLAWRIEMPTRRDGTFAVVVDAHSGQVLSAYVPIIGWR